ncbi:MAG TPA: CotO family spore coat protein [Pseudogracilibacillus sp.]|nr:CotO family spore coat protein [Pseudogracilibacillus sp.]
MKQKFKDGPLLYIAQPKLKSPRRNMQTEFTSFSKTILPKQASEKTKSFHHRSIEGKINYLLELPRTYFQLRCKVITEQETYYGTIEAKHNDTIELLHLGRERKTVPIEAILEIELLGL